MKLFSGHRYIDLTLLAIIIIVIITLVAHIAPTQGQDVTPTAPPVVTTPAPVSNLTDNVLTDVEKFLGTYAGIVGIASAFIVGILRKVSLLDNVDARVLNLLTNGVLVVGLLLATNFGFGAKYTAVIDALPQVGQIVLGLLAAFGGTVAVHEAAYAYYVPVFGDKRGVSAQAVRPDHSR